MRVCSFLLSLLLLLAAPCGAASLEETFAQAQAAFKAGDFARAGELFAAAGDQLQKSGDAARAGALWGNAAVAHKKGENWAAAAGLYERILAANKRLPQEQVRRIYNDLVDCRGKLNQRALQVTTIDRMLKALPKLPPAELAGIYAHQGDAYRLMELYGPAVASYDKAAHLLPADAPAVQKARIFTALGRCRGILGDYAKAAQNLEQARTLATAVNESLTIAEADSLLGVIHMMRGDYPKAMELLKRALDVEEKAGLRRSEGIDRNNLGLVHKAVGNHQEAMRQVEQSLAIAREVKNVRDEAIAMVNRALIHRIAGKLHEARADYREAMKLFEQCGFQEGMAGALLSIGRMEALADKNYALALENYQKALDIYTRLSLPRDRAETLLQLGNVYKYTAAPGRTTRDLVFDDEPTLPAVAPDKAIEQSRAYYAQALDIAQQLQSREMIWSAHQGLGYADLREGRLEDALRHYMTAIDIVTSMYASLESVELLGEYMAGKEDLYSEAQEVCAALYEKTKDKKYLDLQMKYAETLRNEVQKASAALVQLQFEDKDKQALYEKLQVLGRQQAKAAKTVPMAKTLPKDATPEQKAEKALSDKAIKEQKAAVQKLEGDYKKALAEWEKKYPEDAVLFKSNSRVDTEFIQKYLKADQAVLSYIMLPDKLLISIITKDNVRLEPVDIEKSKLKELIIDKFVVEHIHKGEGNIYSTLHDLYNLLIRPIEDDVAFVKHLYIVNSDYLSMLPYSALVKENNTNIKFIKFLIEDYNIGYLRPSFIDAININNANAKVKRMLAVANPVNENFDMGTLPGTITEVQYANVIFKDAQTEKDIALEPKGKKNKDISNEVYNKFTEIASIDKPTEQWLRKKLYANKYEVIYFATHGQAHSDTLTKIAAGIRDKESKGETLSLRQQRMAQMLKQNLRGNSPFNGFIYLSNEDGADILKGDISQENDGLLTIKEILQLNRSSFSGVKYIILSACNAAITMVPFAFSEGFEEDKMFDVKQKEKDMTAQGWIPGVDQATFVEAFMRHGVSDVYASFWPVHDGTSPAYMNRFLENIIAQGSNANPIAALSEAHRTYIKEAKEGKKHGGVADCISPFYWAVGAIFGK